MGHADQQIRDGGNTNLVSLYSTTRTGQICVFLEKQARTQMVRTFLSAALSGPLKAFTSPIWNHCRRKAEVREKFYLHHECKPWT